MKKFILLVILYFLLMTCAYTKVGPTTDDYINFFLGQKFFSEKKFEKAYYFFNNINNNTYIQKYS